MKKKILMGLSALALSMIVSMPAAQAGGLLAEARLGVLAQGWGGPGVSREQGAAINLEAVFHSPDFLSAIGGPRPVVGVTVATDDEATSHLYGGAEWQINFSNRIYLNAMGGLAVHNGETDFDPATDTARLGDTVFYGCRVLFRLSGELGYRVTDDFAVGINAAHLSNAGLCDVNEGLDQVGLRFSYSF